MQPEGLTALIYGATGAVGSQIVVQLLDSPKWARIHCVVRKYLPEWKEHPNYNKMQLYKFESLDDYFSQPRPYKNVNSLFSCFGSQVKHGEETFVKVDKTYPLWAADIAKNNNIPHYLLVSSTGSNPDSWFMYLRVKGECERDLKLKQLNLLSIFQPGLLRNRKDARTIEKIVQVLPFVSGIEAKDAASSLIRVAEKYANEADKMKNEVRIYNNDAMLSIMNLN